MTTELLSAHDICVSYGAVAALDGVSIHVDEGEVVSVIGSNGAGKTTLMKTVAGLLASRSGVIRFRGPGHHRCRGAGPGRPRHLARARGASGVRPDERRGEPGPGRLQPPRASRSRTTSRTASPSFPDSRSAGARGPGRSRAGSSRCSPSPAA